MMSALQRIVLVAAILTIMTVIADEGNAYLCFSDRACQNLVTSVRILFDQSLKSFLYNFDIIIMT